MNEVKNIKKLKTWERFLNGLWNLLMGALAVVILLGLGFTAAMWLGSDTAVALPEEAQPVFVTATPTAVAPTGQTVIIHNNVSVTAPTAPTAVCEIQSAESVGFNQMVVVRGAERQTKIGYEYMGCDGLPKTAVVCHEVIEDTCFMLIPSVPVGRPLYITAVWRDNAHKTVVNVADPYWLIDLNGIVEEPLTTDGE